MNDVVNAGTDVRSKVISFLVEFTGNESLREIDDGMELSDCGLDSLSLFNFLLDLEKELGFAIPERDFSFARVRHFSGLVTVVSENLKSPGEMSCSTSGTA
jgi:acyl carrier protein